MTIKKLNECSYRQLYRYKMKNFQKILDGDLEFPWALFMLLDHPKFELESSKEKAEDIKKIIKELDSKWKEDFVLVFEGDED